MIEEFDIDGMEGCTYQGDGDGSEGIMVSGNYLDAVRLEGIQRELAARGEAKPKLNWFIVGDYVDMSIRPTTLELSEDDILDMLLALQIRKYRTKKLTNAEKVAKCKELMSGAENLQTIVNQVRDVLEGESPGT